MISDCFVTNTTLGNFPKLIKPRLPIVIKFFGKLKTLSIKIKKKRVIKHLNGMRYNVNYKSEVSLFEIYSYNGILNIKDENNYLLIPPEVQITEDDLKYIQFDQACNICKIQGKYFNYYLSLFTDTKQF